MIRGARASGEGCAITAADYATALLYNGLGQYELAFDAAQKAVASDDIATRRGRSTSWSRPPPACGRNEVARDAAERLSAARQRQRHRNGRREPRRARARSSRTATTPRSSTARRSSGSADAGWRHTWPGPG